MDAKPPMHRRETDPRTSGELLNISERKRAIRTHAAANREAQPNKDAISREIFRQLLSLPAFQAAHTLMSYVDVRSEVRTRYDLPQLLANNRRIVVPYCVADSLKLFHLESMQEFEIGTFQVLEPKPELRGVASKQVSARELDLVIVPGVAFDRRGARLGHGKGYYDRLLAEVRNDAALIGLAFECQLFDEIPTEPHDVLMNHVVTQCAVYEGRRGKGEE